LRCPSYYTAGFIRAIQQPRDTSRWPQIDVPDQINPLLDPDLGVHAVAQITKGTNRPDRPNIGTGIASRSTFTANPCRLISPARRNHAI
jgi:hypothetical protein